MNDYHHTSHRVFSLKAHIVLCTKYRYEVITNMFEDFIKEKIKELGLKKDFKVVEIKADKNHIHILIDYSIFSSGEEIIKAIKGYTTIKAFKTHKQYLDKYYRGEHLLWSGGGFICSTGQGSEGVVAEYIRNQGFKK